MRAVSSPLAVQVHLTKLCVHIVASLALRLLALLSCSKRRLASSLALLCCLCRGLCLLLLLLLLHHGVLHHGHLLLHERHPLRVLLGRHGGLAATRAGQREGKRGWRSLRHSRHGRLQRQSGYTRLLRWLYCGCGWRDSGCAGRSAGWLLCLLRRPSGRSERRGRARLWRDGSAVQLLLASCTAIAAAAVRTGGMAGGSTALHAVRLWRVGCRLR